MPENDFDIKSTGKSADTKKAEAKLKQMKAAAEKDVKAAKAAAAKTEAKHKKEVESAKKKLKAAQKSAQKKNTAARKKLKKSEKALEGAAIAAGGVLLDTLTDENTSPKKKGLILGGLVVAAAVLATLFFLFKPQLQNLLGFQDTSLPSSLEEFLPDEEMGYNKIDFTNAVLGETRKEKELIVLEQDVEVETEISNAFANIGIFKKSKMIYTTGTGEYTVDMSKIGEDDIAVDLEKKIVTVTIPEVELHTVAVKETRLDKTNKSSIFAIGDIKMTQEQQQILTESIDESMRDVLETKAMYKLANETACMEVREIYQPVITAVSEEFVVKVIQ